MSKSLKAGNSSKMVFNLKPGYVFYGKTRPGKPGKKFKIIDKIGEGGMGAVYEVEEMTTKTRYAVKCEKFESVQQKHPVRKDALNIALEKHIMKACAASPYFPDYIDAGHTDSFGWIAMELVGQTLGELRRNTPDRRFTVTTCLKIAVQLVKGLRDLHSKGFVHRDLKPLNLAIGLGPKSDTICILDTGISRQFKTVHGVIQLPRQNIKFQGTWDFAPLALHLKQEYGPKDDLESMFYVLAELHLFKLPWSDINGEQAVAKSKQACRTHLDKILGQTELCSLLHALWEYTIKLRYEETVDYKFFVNTLTIALNRYGGESATFDWENFVAID